MARIRALSRWAKHKHIRSLPVTTFLLFFHCCRASSGSASTRSVSKSTRLDISPFGRPIIGASGCLILVWKNVLLVKYLQMFSHSTRLLDVDGCFNFREVYADPDNLNAVVCVWYSSAPCSLSLKAHCVSTEFTAKKHGGEKGVPFRIQVSLC